MIICLMCGTGNQPNTNHCVQCGARLPKLDDRTVGNATTHRQMGKYDKLKAAVIKVKTGELSWAEFIDWFHGFSEEILSRINTLLDNIHKAHGDDKNYWNYYEEFTEEVETIFAGVEDYEAAINQIWLAVEEQDLVATQAAVKLFLRGAEKLNDALILNGETVRKLEEGWGYL